MINSDMQDDHAAIIAAVYEHLELTTCRNDRNKWNDKAHNDFPRPLTLLTDNASLDEIISSEADFVGDSELMVIYPRILWIGMYHVLKYGTPNAYTIQVR